MKKSSILFSIGFIICILVSSPIVCFALPTIESVTGTVSTGQTLTLSGSGLMALDVSYWLNSLTGASFEGARSFSQQANVDGWSYQGGCSASYVTDGKLIGNSAAYLIQNCCSCPAGATSCCGNRLLSYNANGRSEVYIAGYFRYTGNQWPTNYMKFMMGNSGNTNWYFQPWTWENQKIASYVVGDTGAYSTFRAPSPIGFNEWHHMELRLKYSSPKTMQAWIDGQLIGTVTPTGSGVTWDEIGFPNLAGLSAPNWVAIHLDLITYSTSRIYPASKIEISNNSKYGSGSVKWQQPLSLGDETIQLKLDLTGLGAGPYYLWVTNNRQERSEPIELIGSGGGDPPTAPAGLRIMN